MDAPSAVEDTSPFEIPHDQLESLSASPGFRVLRSCLSHHACFCSHHRHVAQTSKEEFLLHRDILHALAMPVVELYKRASALARAALCTNASEDLELAFAGDARGAFLWLQCFLGEEWEWVQTKGCPACVTLATMSTESHIRFVIAASYLSSSPSYRGTTASPTARARSKEDDHGLQQDADTSLELPPIPQILPALREALGRDEFWGSGHWSYLVERATLLSTGIEALVVSCFDLEALVASPTGRKPAASRSVTMPAVLHPLRAQEQKGVKMKTSKLANRQLRMKAEEMELMRRCALQVWARAAVPSKLRNEILGRTERRRSLTCP
ncbi:hypothetical protein M011DRAFT_466697 [Sporormia fimetaria CBS 119925]|uniref:Uncharacterized protein n=1 Tax=Sporormia fimetaria CBS 119925 TaxID=1340428 RepID=A0A6A6VCD4_9PLEO|nr:hypothetical protein M011DRAFT_466697 [Sporormia fimetaria CBS 119925]